MSTAPSKDRVLLKATISPHAVKYQLVSTAFILTACIVTIPLLPIILPIMWFFVNLHYKHLSCELTETALKVNRGVFNRQEKTVPLEKITDVALNQGPIMRWMKIESLGVETAGQSGVGALINLVGVENSRTFRDAVLEQKDIVLGRKSDANAPKTTAPSQQTTEQNTELAEIRDILLRIEEKLGSS